jgi:hypothetical protein
MPEEFKIMPAKGSAIVTLLPYRPVAAVTTLGGRIYCYYLGSPNDPSNNTSNHDIFKTTESLQLYTLDSRISDFPLKNAPCKNAHYLSLPLFEPHLSSFQLLHSTGPHFLLSSFLLPSSQLLTSQSSSGTGDELTGVPKEVQ